MTSPHDAARQRVRRTRTQRFEAFSDGVFAIAITLLVLDLAVPFTAASRANLLREVAHQWPEYLGYLISFATIGAIWLGHNAVSDYLERADTTLLRINLLLLLFVSFLPFPTRLLSGFIREGHAERVAVTFYGLTLLAAAGVLAVLWRYARSAGLVQPDAEDHELTLLTQ
ncbi:MAG TPA: TMEM175 family protein, partial [Acidimicrobiales bacterium]|nr:TMEM175 family protein [Acidimicrobiales bacterium]